MKLAITGFIAGLLLAGGTAMAATSSYWHGSGNGYVCAGTASGGICDQTSGWYRWHVLVSRKDIVIFKGKNTPVMECFANRSSDACEDYRP